MTESNVQQRAVAFAEAHGLDADPPYRLLDLASEVGEMAADACAATDYGAAPDEFGLSEDEVGDAVFSLMLVADAVDVDAAEALETSLAKYERRLDGTGQAGSGEADFE